MKNHLTIEHKKLFEEIKRNLSALGAKESSFINVELLFYKAITVAREYGNNEADNSLLAALKDLQANQYREAKVPAKTSVQQERVIRRFISSLKNVLSAGVKNVFSQPQFT